MLQGSFLPLTMAFSIHLSFLTAGIVRFSFAMNLKPAWLGRISHHGQSVSNNILSDGSVFTVSKLFEVFKELQRHKLLEYIAKKNVLPSV